MKYYFKIANINIMIESEFDIQWNSYIKNFLCTRINYCDVYYQCILCDEFNIEGELIYKDSNILIYDNQGYEERLYFFYGQNVPSMFYKEYKDKIIIYLNKYHMCSFVYKDNYCVFNALAFEKQLIQYNAIVLHCSYIIINNKAILFTAPSGTGKSTQAGLWEKYRNACIINGDRAIIQKLNNCYHARGMPICGSSNICINRDSRIEAIVYLSQNKINSIKRLNVNEAIKKIISETTINYFNQNFINKAIDIITDLSLEIPIYHLSCTKDENAVKCLENVLEDIEQ